MFPEQVAANISSDLATLCRDQVEQLPTCSPVSKLSQCKQSCHGANGDSQPRCRTLRALLTHPPSQKHGAWRKSWADRTQILFPSFMARQPWGTRSASQSCHTLPFAFSNVAENYEPLTPQDRAHRLSVVCRTSWLEHKPNRVSSFWRGLKGSNFSRVYSHAHPQLSQRADSRHLVLNT